MTTKNSKIILVPTDFSKVAENALNHAISTAEHIGAKIYLLHVVEKPSQVAEARTKLAEKAKIVENVLGEDRVDTLARIGNIFEDIADVAVEISAEIIFMGTHGVTGMQHILGSRALKVITNSDVPFVVVQNKGIKENGYDDIVVPIDFSVETKQKLHYVANMAKFFNSRVHLIAPRETDEWLEAKVSRNLNFAKQFMKDNDVAFDAKVDEEKGSNFAKHIIRYAAEIDADLITIMNIHKNGLLGVLGASYEQEMINNDAEIPVMVVNPFESTVGGGHMLFS